MRATGTMADHGNMKINIELSREEVEAGLDFLARPRNEELMDFLKSIAPYLIQEYGKVFNHSGRRQTAEEPSSTED